MRKHWLHHALAGVLIGIACILPGASGGMLAVAFGLYRPMLNAVMHFFREPAKSLRFLLPLAAGIGSGILLGAAGLAGAMARHERLMLFLFIGLILGGIPDLIHEAGRFRPRRLLSLAGGVLLTLPLIMLSSSVNAVMSLSPLQALAAGLLEGIGTVVPGVSTSFVLIRLGWYQAYLQAVSGMQLLPLVLIAAGFAVSALLCMHMVQRLFDSHPGHAYYAVLGFVLVSIVMVFPGFTLGREIWAQLSMMIAGMTLVRLLGNLQYSKG